MICAVLRKIIQVRKYYFLDKTVSYPLMIPHTFVHPVSKYQHAWSIFLTILGTVHLTVYISTTGFRHYELNIALSHPMRMLVGVVHTFLYHSKKVGEGPSL